MAISGLMRVMEKAARKAGQRLRRDFGEVEHLQVSRKGPADFVSKADQQSERTLWDELRAARPDWGFVMEEGGTIEGDPNKPRFIIDPLDGTTNFLHGFPAFAVSIAVEHRGRLEHAVVYDPMRQEFFTASRGDGAQVEGKKIRVSSQRSLEGSLIGTGFPYRMDAEHVDSYLAMLKVVMATAAGVRRPGAASLDLAYVAAGRLDGFWEFGLKPWDTAAGVLLIQEAGGRVGTPAGGDYALGPNIVAGNPKVFEELVAALRPLTPEGLRL